MKWIKQHIVPVLITIIMGACVTMYTEYRALKSEQTMKDFIQDPETLEPTIFIQKNVINPTVMQTIIEVEKILKDSSKWSVIAAGMQIDVDQLTHNNNIATKIFHGFDSLGITPSQIVASFAKDKEEIIDPRYIIRGFYRIDIEEKKYTDYYDVENDSWRELYYSIHAEYKGRYCHPFWWCLRKNGSVNLRRDISHMILCK